MSNEEEKYKCPKCGCQDQILRIGPIGTGIEDKPKAILYRKIDGTWRPVEERYEVILEYYRCPVCEKFLPQDLVAQWDKEPRED